VEQILPQLTDELCWRVRFLMKDEREMYARRLASIWRADPDKVECVKEHWVRLGRTDLLSPNWAIGEADSVILGVFPRFAFWMWNTTGATIAAATLRPLTAAGESIWPRLIPRLGARLNRKTFHYLKRLPYHEFSEELETYWGLPPDTPVDVAPWFWDQPTNNYPLLPRPYFFEDGERGDADSGWRPDSGFMPLI
jgi:hypothetical protein